MTEQNNTEMYYVKTAGDQVSMLLMNGSVIMAEFFIWQDALDVAKLLNDKG